MDIPDELEKAKTAKTYKKAPKLKNLKRGSTFNTIDVKDPQNDVKANNTLNVDTHTITRQRRASFGNLLQTDLANTIKKSKSSENIHKTSETEIKSKVPVKKKILQRFRSVDESKDLKTSFLPSKKSGKNKLLMTRKTTSLDLTTEELLIKQKSKKVNKMAMIPDTNETPDLPSMTSSETKPTPKKPTTLTGEAINLTIFVLP